MAPDALAVNSDDFFNADGPDCPKGVIEPELEPGWSGLNEGNPVPGSPDNRE